MPGTAKSARKSMARRNRPVIEGMEPRILFSADGLSALLDVPDADAHADVHALDSPPLVPPAAADRHAVARKPSQVARAGS